MGAPKKENTREIERRLLKQQIKEELLEDLDDIILEKMQVIIGPVVAEKLGILFNFPLTIKQVASITGRTENNIYKMCQRNQIPFTKTGGQIHINLKDINRHLLDLEWSEQWHS